MHKNRTLENCIRYRHHKGTAQHVIKSTTARECWQNYCNTLDKTTARARCVFVHVAVSVRLPSPRALRHNAYINTPGQFVRNAGSAAVRPTSAFFICTVYDSAFVFRQQLEVWDDDVVFVCSATTSASVSSTETSKIVSVDFFDHLLSKVDCICYTTVH